ncbi:MAG: PIN domain-containing protein [Dongiaceae bacterium]
MIAIDTNVIARYLVRDDPAQAAAADRILDARSAADPAFVARIVLVELVWVLRRAYKYDHGTVGDVVERILGTSALLVEDRDAATAALAAYRTSTADYADCLLGLLNRGFGCTTTVTLDGDAATLPGFRLL